MSSESITNLDTTNVEYVVEKKELDLTKLEDLDFLVKNAEDLYQDILSYELVAENEDFESLDENKKQGHEIFTLAGLNLVDLKSVVNEVKSEVFSGNLNIDDNQVDTIQSFYNDLISTRNLLATAYAEVDQVEFVQEELLATDEIEKEADTYFFEVTKDEPKSEIEFFIDKDVKHKDLLLNDESDEGNIKIEFKAAQGAKTKIEAEEQSSQLAVDKDLGKAGNSSLLAAEKKDPVNKIVRESKLEQVNQSVKKYIFDDSYADLVKREKIPAKDLLNKRIDNWAQRIEDSSLDLFDRNFGDYKSVFEYIGNLKVKEVQEFSQLPDLKEKLQDNELKYESFLVWLDFINDELIPNKNFLYDELTESAEEATVRDFFSRWVIETQ